MNNDFAIVIPNCITGIIVVIIALASLREIIAMTGIVKPEHKYSWLVYGKYDQNIIIRALCNLGYSKEESERFEKDFRKRASRIEVSINEENAPIYLVILLSAYIMKFDKKIQYGGNTLSNSNYYINTMEMTHNQENLKWLTEIMICLLNKKGEFTTKPDVFIAPKGGNPLFSQSVARRYDRQLILAKSKEDKSRVISDDIYERFSANFEGSWNIINEKKEKTCIVYDCNTSGGSQLLSIVKEINELNNNTEVKLTPPSSVYILFCVDKQPVEETGNKFKDHGLELYRYFDLDEDIKKQLHDLKEKCIKEKRQPDFYNKNDKKAALLIIDSIKKKSKYFF